MNRVNRSGIIASAVCVLLAAGCAPAGDPWPGDPDSTDAAGATDAGGISDSGTVPVEPEVCDGLDNDGNGLADDGPDVCPCPVERFGGAPYLFCAEAVTWEEAEGSCAFVGYHLLTVNSAAEDAWADAAADSYSTSEWWMGMNDRASEGTWVWQDGSPVTYENWEENGCCGLEPNDFFGEDCAVLNFYPETWNDLPCGDTYFFVCEAD